MLWNLLTSAADTSSSGTGTTGGCNALSFLPWLLILGAAAILWIFSKRSQKKREEEINNTLDAIQPGNKVKTIGGICGVVVEVCPEDNTFILETGSETSGKSYMRFDKKAVYQTDAATPVAAETEEAETTEEAPFEEGAAPEVVEEAPVEEATEESAEEVETKEE